MLTLQPFEEALFCHIVAYLCIYHELNDKPSYNSIETMVHSVCDLIFQCF